MFAESRLRNNATPKLGIRVDCTRRSPLAGNNAKSDRRDFRLNGPLQSQAAQRAFQGTERCFTRIQLCATGIPVRGDKDRSAVEAIEARLPFPSLVYLSQASRKRRNARSLIRYVDKAAPGRLV